MSGRGDNNKSGSAGRGASNQSNQPFGQTSNKKSNHGEASGKPSVPQPRKKDQSSNRNQSTDKENE